MLDMRRIRLQKSWIGRMFYSVANEVHVSSR